MYFNQPLKVIKLATEVSQQIMEACSGGGVRGRFSASVLVGRAHNRGQNLACFIVSDKVRLACQVSLCGVYYRWKRDALPSANAVRTREGIIEGRSCSICGELLRNRVSVRREDVGFIIIHIFSLQFYKMINSTSPVEFCYIY